jgi:hypothetical protein
MREMKDLNNVLREGDPAAGDEGLSPGQSTVMRRQIINAAEHPDVVRTPWQQPLAVAAMVALTIVAGIVGGQRLGDRLDSPPSVASGSDVPDGTRRQLQFSTPGGTRIIWVFDPDFAVKETVP